MKGPQTPKRRLFKYGETSYPYELHIGGVKRLNLRVRPDGSIRLSVPHWTTQRQIDAFLTKCLPKINEALRRIDGKQASQVPLTDQEAKQEQLLTLIRACHKDVVLPRFDALDLELTEEQRRFIFSPEVIRIRPMKSQWGSCHFKKGVLTFNLYLVDQPLECIEYVVMHEFAHFIHPNHSPAYHALMTALMPDWKARKARLNSNV